MLREAAAPRALLVAERAQTAQLQALIDQTGATLQAEEAELARRRDELDRDEFERRAADFDRRRRLARAVAQDRAQRLQKNFQEARSVILDALPGIIERVRAETGARLVLSAEQVVAAAPGTDLTDRVIALFDAEGPRPAVPDIDLDDPILEPAATTDQPDVPPAE